MEAPFDRLLAKHIDRRMLIMIANNLLMRRLQTKLKYQKVELHIYKTTHLSKNIKNYSNKHLILRRGLFAKAAFANMQIFIVFVKKGGAMP